MTTVWYNVSSSTDIVPLALVLAVNNVQIDGDSFLLFLNILKKKNSRKCQYIQIFTIYLFIQIVTSMIFIYSASLVHEFTIAVNYCIHSLSEYVEAGLDKCIF
jgi:hypothetical protein